MAWEEAGNGKPKMQTGGFCFAKRDDPRAVSWRGKQEEYLLEQFRCLTHVLVPGEGLVEDGALLDVHLRVDGTTAFHVGTE